MSLDIINRSDLAQCDGVFDWRRDRRKTFPQKIVIHRNTASQTWIAQNPDKHFDSDIDALADFHTKSAWRFRLFPYHYFIDRDGLVYQVHDEMTVSPHAPNHGNWRSIGIAVNFDGRREGLNDLAEESIILLCRDILKRWPSCDIVGHSMAKRCPGPMIGVSSISKKARGPEGIPNKGGKQV